MKKFNTIRASELFTKEIQRTPFIVEEILPRYFVDFQKVLKTLEFTAISVNPMAIELLT